MVGKFQYCVLFQYCPPTFSFCNTPGATMSAGFTLMGLSCDVDSPVDRFEYPVPVSYSIGDHDELKLLHVMLLFITGFGKMLWLVAAAVAGGLVAVGWLAASATKPPNTIRTAKKMAAHRVIWGVFPMISLCVIGMDTCTKYISSFVQNAYILFML